MINKVLIANRGEIAIRIIRACHELGIKTVAVYSEADRNSLHVQLADESVCIGPGPAIESYLNIPNLISAATITNSDAIHPGYGFLAENPYFAEVCESCGIKFIGPSKETIQKMGNKIIARNLMKKAGVPIVPGTITPISIDDPELFKVAKKIGYPLIIKAASGGGGRGMRIVPSEESLKNAITTAQIEAKASFGDDQVFLEKFIENPRHIEFQIAADIKGNVVFFPERDCSIQRRHQKLIEESPGVRISKSLRKKMGSIAARAAKAVKYLTVGTVEFILDQKENFYFLEMNTRIQVEHPVSEMISGIDLVKEQIKIADNIALEISQSDVKLEGHSIECRVNAESPEEGFQPYPGRITQWNLPKGDGIRVDTHCFSGYVVPPYYDSLIAKVITRGINRSEAIEKIQYALDSFIISGIPTTIPFLKFLITQKDFIAGKVNTRWVEELFPNNKNKY